MSFQLDFNDCKLWGYFVPRCYKNGGGVLDEDCLSGSSYRLPTESNSKCWRVKQTAVKALGEWTKHALFRETQRGHIKNTIKNGCSSASNLLGIKQQGWICGETTVKAAERHIPGLPQYWLEAKVQTT